MSVVLSCCACLIGEEVLDVVDLCVQDVADATLIALQLPFLVL